MIWLIVLIISIVLLILGFLFFDEDYRFPFQLLECISLVVIVGICPIIRSAEQTYDEIIYDNIYSVRGSDNEVDGRFFLGSGTIKTESYYVVFVEDAKGLKMEKFNTDNTYIVEVDDGNYYVRNTKEKWSLYDYYTIYVPEGTVIVEFKI